MLVLTKNLRKKFLLINESGDELGLYLNKFDGLKIPRAKKYLFTGKECARNF